MGVAYQVNNLNLGQLIKLAIIPSKKSTTDFRMKALYMISNYLINYIICWRGFKMIMKPLTRIFTKGMLLAAVLSIAATGIIATSATLGQSSPAAAQTYTTTTNTTDTASNATGTAAAGNNSLAGIIASLQLEDLIAPQWVTAGYWELESDQPIFGGNNQSEPTVTSFNAVVDMARFDNGTFLHGHTFSDFKQSDILYSTGNSTTINGTMTVTTEDGPTEEVPTYITLRNNLITIFVNPEAVDNHFGPTPISGLILTTEKLQEISDLLSTTGETEAAGQNNTLVTGATGNVTGQ